MAGSGNSLTDSYRQCSAFFYTFAFGGSGNTDLIHSFYLSFFFSYSDGPLYTLQFPVPTKSCQAGWLTVGSGKAALDNLAESLGIKLAENNAGSAFHMV